MPKDCQWVVDPATAVTEVNNEEDFLWVLIQVGISAFLYFSVGHPIIMNWLMIRWYRRNLLEMYVQFMFVFMFFPGSIYITTGCWSSPPKELN